MSSLIDRLFTRIYWFYDRVIKESDEDMRFYFTSFAISFILFFYFNFMVIYIYTLTDWSVLRPERVKTTSLTFLFVGTLVYWFFKKRKYFNALIEKEKYNSFAATDFIIIAFVFLGIFVGWFAFYLLRLHWGNG